MIYMSSVDQGRKYTLRGEVFPVDALGVKAGTQVELVITGRLQDFDMLAVGTDVHRGGLKLRALFNGATMAGVYLQGFLLHEAVKAAILEHKDIMSLCLCGLAMNFGANVNHLGVIKDACHHGLAAAKSECRNLAVVGNMGDVISVLVNFDATLEDDAVAEVQLVVKVVAVLISIGRQLPGERKMFDVILLDKLDFCRGRQDSDRNAAGVKDCLPDLITDMSDGAVGMVNLQ